MKSQSTNKKVFLVLEPYIFVRRKKNQLLLYNFMDGNYIINNSPLVSAVFKYNYSKMHIYKINNVCEQDEGLNEFIHEVERLFFGFRIETNSIKSLPIQFSPAVNIQSDRDITIFDFSRSDKALINLTEITVYLNSHPNTNELFFKEANKQIICPSTDTIESELDLNKLVTFLNPCLKGDSLKILNIAGWQIDKYRYYQGLLSFVEQNELIFNFYVLINDNLDFLTNEILKNKPNIHFKIIVKPTLTKFEIKRLETLYSLCNNIDFHFVISSEKDYIYFEDIISKTQIKKFTFKPYYNGTNFNFFNESMFIEKEDIFSKVQTLNDIYSNILMNPLHFGKIQILSSGNVFANLNRNILGNIFDNNIYEIIYKEIKTGKTWFQSKSKNKPCKDCIYDFLCPPISNYEYVIKKNNLCSIN